MSRTLAVGRRTHYPPSVFSTVKVCVPSEPPTGAELWPVTFGNTISLLVTDLSFSSGKISAPPEELADCAVKLFWQDQVLPRAGTKHDHHETITRDDTLALARLELWPARTESKPPLAFERIDR